MAVAESIVGVAGKVLNKFVADKDLKVKLQHELKTAFHAANLAQIDLNKQEAAHQSMFVAGWRPAIGWICALGLLYNTIIANIISIWVDVPEVATTLLVPVMMGMLGLGAMRSYEKVNSVAREK